MAFPHNPYKILALDLDGTTFGVRTQLSEASEDFKTCSASIIRSLSQMQRSIDDSRTRLSQLNVPEEKPAKPAPAWTRKRINTDNAAAPWMVRRHCSAMNSDKLLKNILLASKYR